MSFFKKLKDRLFRSSDKISDGLDALVAEGAEDEAAKSAAAEAARAEDEIEASVTRRANLPNPRWRRRPPLSPRPLLSLIRPLNLRLHQHPNRPRLRPLRLLRPWSWPPGLPQRSRTLNPPSPAFWGACSGARPRTSRAGCWMTPCWKAWRNC